MLETHAVSSRIDQLVLENLDTRAWRGQLSGGKGRTIAAIFTHVHNVRCKWLRLSAPHLNVPPRLDRSRCTQKQAKKALAESAALCSRMLSEAFASNGASEGGVKIFHRDGWARPWTPGAAMFGYMVVHEAHHRGQVCMLAHQLGFPLPEKIAYGMWGWERLWKQCGFGLPK